MLINTAEKRKPGFRLAACATAFAVCVIILGAFTRLADAGLGCPDWPVCYGHILWPMDAEEVAVANAAFPDTPVEHDKTWPEQVHRLLATGLGFFCIALVGLAWRDRIKNRDRLSPFKLPLILLGMVILQGMFGRWTVTLNLWPQVVTAHLMGGFTTLSLLWLLTLRLNNYQWTVSPSVMQSLQSIKPVLITVFVLVVFQIMLGGWTSSNYAALACPDLPMCQTVWWPTMDFATGFNFAQDIGPNYLGGVMDSAARTAIHFSHRIGAIIVTISVLYLVWRLLKTGLPAAKLWAVTLAVVLFVQVSLGLSNVIWSLPLPVAVAHNAVGAMLMLVFVGLSHRFYTAKVQA